MMQCSKRSRQILVCIDGICTVMIVVVNVIADHVALLDLVGDSH